MRTQLVESTTCTSGYGASTASRRPAYSNKDPMPRRIARFRSSR